MCSISWHSIWLNCRIMQSKKDRKLLDVCLLLSFFIWTVVTKSFFLISFWSVCYFISSILSFNLYIFCIKNTWDSAIKEKKDDCELKNHLQQNWMCKPNWQRKKNLNYDRKVDRKKKLVWEMSSICRRRVEEAFSLNRKMYKYWKSIGGCANSICKFFISFHN